jgi:hypothetical protein
MSQWVNLLIVSTMDKARMDAHVLEPDSGALHTGENLVSALVVACHALVGHLPSMRTLLVEPWSDDAIVRDCFIRQVSRV